MFAICKQNRNKANKNKISKSNELQNIGDIETLHQNQMYT